MENLILFWRVGRVFGKVAEGSLAKGGGFFGGMGGARREEVGRDFQIQTGN